MLELPSIFSDGVVIQHGEAAPVWGRADPGAIVLVEIKGKRFTARADELGDWTATMDPFEPGGPCSMRVLVEGGTESIRLEDVYFGDVWLCSGQSNMQIPMSRLMDDYPEEFALSPFPVIRQFALPCVVDFSGPRKDVPLARWSQASAESLGDFSGVGWFFARHEQMRRSIPVGLVLAAQGGAPIEALMSKESLAEWPDRIAEGERYADEALREKALGRAARATGDWEARVRDGDLGLKEGWSEPGAEDSTWDDLRLPGRFDEAEELRGFCGALWLRRSFMAPGGFEGEGCRIWLGTIADADRVFVNGVEVGGTGYRYPPRKYSIPAGLIREGENRIAIRVQCNQGDGGVTRGKRFEILPGPGAKGRLQIDLRGAWKYRIGFGAGPRPPELFLNWFPTGLFNGMIAPLLGCALRGVLWYQGEANERRPEEYRRLFESMVLDWRRRNGRDDLPFLFVQLPILGKPSENDELHEWALLREAQQDALGVPRTGMAVSLDVGEWNDLHPLDKKTVGQRLALAAEALLYGERNASPGPVLERVERKGARIFLSFRNCGVGLEARDGNAGRATVFVSIVDDEGASTRRPARIEAPDRLSIDVSGIVRPALVLYAWANNPADRQLYNGDGLPALPFRVVVPAT